jgi:hypothetical protein
LLRIVLDRKKLLDRDITINEVSNTIKEEFKPNLAVIFSDPNADEQIIRVRFIWDGNLQKDEDDEDERDERWMRKLEKHLLDDVTLRGVRGIERAFIRELKVVAENDDRSLILSKSDPRCNEWVLDTTGTALADVLAIDGVNPTKTYCNSFIEILGVLGIEAARAGLLKELAMVLSFDGSYVNHRHMALLVDIMTQRGLLMAITRHGITATTRELSCVVLSRRQSKFFLRLPASVSSMIAVVCPKTLCSVSWRLWVPESLILLWTIPCFLPWSRTTRRSWVVPQLLVTIWTMVLLHHTTWAPQRTKAAWVWVVTMLLSLLSLPQVPTT